MNIRLVTCIKSQIGKLYVSLDASESFIETSYTATIMICCSARVWVRAVFFLDPSKQNTNICSGKTLSSVGCLVWPVQSVDPFHSPSNNCRSNVRNNTKPKRVHYVNVTGCAWLYPIGILFTLCSTLNISFADVSEFGRRCEHRVNKILFSTFPIAAICLCTPRVPNIRVCEKHKLDAYTSLPLLGGGALVRGHVNDVRL